MPNRVHACVATTRTKLLRHFNTILNFTPCNHCVQREQISPLPTPGAILFYLEYRRTLKCLVQNLSTVTLANLEHWAYT